MYFLETEKLALLTDVAKELGGREPSIMFVCCHYMEFFLSQFLPVKRKASTWMLRTISQAYCN